MTDDALPELRASDADRERTADLLRHAAGEGRLTMDELDERLDLVYETRTQRELDKLTADVVVPGDAQRVQSRMPVKSGAGGSEWVVSVMSGHDRKGRWRVGRAPEGHQHHGRLERRPQRRRARPSRDTTITVFSLMGGSEIRVPDDVNVVVSDFAFMGGNDAKVGEMLPDPGGPTIHIKLISIMGGSDIQRGRKLCRAERKASSTPRALPGLARAPRGTSSAVIEPIAMRSVVPGGDHRGRRARRAAARGGRTACGRARRRTGAARGRRPGARSRQPGGDQVRAVPQLPAPALERQAPGRQRVQAVGELEAVDSRHVGRQR